jgi:hypothetical protein
MSVPQSLERLNAKKQLTTASDKNSNKPLAGKPETENDAAPDFLPARS